MQDLIIFFLIFSPALVLGQINQESDSSNNEQTVFKKRVLENTEIDLLTSLYYQDGNNAAVTGGIGKEELTDFASNINIAIPLNEDDVLNIDGTISAYSSASSSNLDPFSRTENNMLTGTPWVASSGASKSDSWVNGTISYNHSSDDRNFIYSTNLNFATEYDYTSFGSGIGLTSLFNQKNTELSILGNVFIDSWNPHYPIELISYLDANGNLNSTIFNQIDILDQNSNPVDKSSDKIWRPLKSTLINNKSRNSFSISLSFSQILSRNMQISIFTDITYQKGWLANPLQRVYFSDKDNYYVGNPSNISQYDNPSNTDVFHLADDIERLPDERLKIPIGVRLNYFINEYFVIKSYYRYYTDDWGIKSNVFNVELPIKVAEKFTIYPSYRYYVQTESDYFAPYDQHLSTDQYYTSDFDLSNYSSNQFGFGLKYQDIFTEKGIWKFGLKDLTVDYKYYHRTTGLSAHIISLGAKFILDQ